MNTDEMIRQTRGQDAEQRAEEERRQANEDAWGATQMLGLLIVAAWTVLLGLAAVCVVAWLRELMT